MAGTHPADPIADAFESHRDRLRAVAYRMLGSHADAEDVVQEAWLRLSRQDTDTIDNLGGWLTTVVGRISLDVLRFKDWFRSITTRPALNNVPMSRAVSSASPRVTAYAAGAITTAMPIVMTSAMPFREALIVILSWPIIEYRSLPHRPKERLRCRLGPGEAT
jgi:RNA polymerase sigma factor (sigma-70 family)